jgi:hypothetical protein
MNNTEPAASGGAKSYDVFSINVSSEYIVLATYTVCDGFKTSWCGIMKEAAPGK